MNSPLSRRSSARWATGAALAIPVLLLLSCVKSGGPATSREAGGASTRSAPVIGIEELSRLDLLARLKPSVKVGLVSSYDRSGGNDDGFSGKYSFIRKEPGGLVIADLPGPGVIYRIHTPTPTDDVVEFTFDGEPMPRLSLRINQLFDGTRPPFLAPLVGAGVGGYTSYVPLTYRRSCKIVVKAETFQFYDINYAVFPAEADVPTYEDPPGPDFLAGVEKAATLLRRAGTDVSGALVPAGMPVSKKTVKARLEPGRNMVLYKTSKPGRVLGLRIGPAAAFAGGGRDLLVRAYWDGAAEPAIDCPASDLFGYSFGDPAVRSLMLGTTDAGVDYLYFPMPFERSARLELISERPAGSPAVDVEAEIVTAPVGKRPDEGRFYALWRRENPCTEGRPFTYLRTAGRGHVVGVILQAQGLETGSTGFFEGDDRAVIDGQLAVPGTGSEDSFNGGWYDVPGRWETRTSLPLSGCLDYKKPLARTGGYRFFLTDSYAYTKSIDYTIEHGPEGNKVPTDYTSVVFFYSLDPPAYEPDGRDRRVAGPEQGRGGGKGSGLPPVEARRVTDPRKIVFVPGWNVPVHTTSLENFALAKRSEKIGEQGARFLSMTTSGGDIFGPHHVSFICDLPGTGRYRVGLKAVLGPDQGIVRIFRNGVPAGEQADLYATSRSLSGVLPLGIFDMVKGDNIIFLHLVGKNPRSKGVGFDLVELVFERED